MKTMTDHRENLRRAIELVLRSDPNADTVADLDRAVWSVKMLGVVSPVTAEWIDSVLVSAVPVRDLGPVESELATKISSWVTNIKDVEVIDRLTRRHRVIPLPAERFEIVADELVTDENGKGFHAYTLIWPSGYSLTF